MYPISLICVDNGSERVLGITTRAIFGTAFFLVFTIQKNQVECSQHKNDYVTELVCGLMSVRGSQGVFLPNAQRVS